MNQNIPHPSQSDTTVRKDNLEKQAGRLREYFEMVGDSPLHTVTQLEQRPIHTAIAYMMAAGKSRKEIEASTGVNIVTISMLTRQPWFKQLLTDIAAAAGSDMVKQFLQGEIVPSLEVLRTIRDDTKEKGATRVSAINSLLDRGLGKPVAYIESSSTLNIHTAGRAAETVESELDKINAELRSRGVKLSSDGGKN